jgi:hypothetical protein
MQQLNLFSFSTVHLNDLHAMDFIHVYIAECLRFATTL